VGNDEFLLAVFGDELADGRPMVVSFDGNPASVPEAPGSAGHGNVHPRCPPTYRIAPTTTSASRYLAPTRQANIGDKGSLPEPAYGHAG